MTTVTWTVTPNLQWIKRPTPPGANLPAGEHVMALQQWWTPSDGSTGEWRDVPQTYWGGPSAEPPAG